MEHQYWQNKWQANDLGFHQDAPHPLLQKYFPALELAPGARVFVPLCGKSGDMLCLHAMGYRVIGLELSEIAAQSFFKENKLAFDESAAGAYRLYQSAGIEILCGDFFAATRELIGEVSAVFDRAALIALPEAMRRRYADTMQEVLTAGVRTLLISLEYTQGLISSPPFSVEADEVHELFGTYCDVTLLEKAEAQVKGQPCHELVYRLEVR